MNKQKFFLNKDFFDFYLKGYYPLFDDVYLHIVSKVCYHVSYKKYFTYTSEICVKRDNDFTPVFLFFIDCCDRKIQIRGLKYLIDSPFTQSSVLYYCYAPAWLLPCTRYSVFINRCVLSLRVYRDFDYI